MTWFEVDGVAAAEEVAVQAEALARDSAQFEDVAARWRATQEQLRYIVAVVDEALTSQ